LLPLIYDELRKLASSRLAAEKPARRFRQRTWFMKRISGLSGEANSGMGQSRPFLCGSGRGDAADSPERARDKNRDKRGGDRVRVDLDQVVLALDTNDEQLVELDDALTQLEAEDPDAARLVNCASSQGSH